MPRKRNAALKRHENLRRTLVSPSLTSRAQACLGRRLLLAAVLVELPVLAAFAALPASRPEIAVYLLYGAAILLVLLRRILGIRRHPTNMGSGIASRLSPIPGHPEASSTSPRVHAILSPRQLDGATPRQSSMNECREEGRRMNAGITLRSMSARRPGARLPTRECERGDAAPGFAPRS